MLTLLVHVHVITGDYSDVAYPPAVAASDKIPHAHKKGKIERVSRVGPAVKVLGWQADDVGLIPSFVSPFSVFKSCGLWTPSCEPGWPSGKAGKHRDLGSNLLRLSFLFKSCGLWTLSCGFVPHN